MRKYWRLWVTLVLLAVLAVVNGLHHRAALSETGSDPASVALVRASGWPVSDAEVEALVREAVAMAGGLDDIIEPGDTVVIKPNLVQEGAPDEGYTTDPRVVRAVVRLVQEAGAGEVIIAEGSACYRDGHDARGATVEAFRVCGYDADGDMEDDVTGVPLMDLNDAGGLDQRDPNLVTQVDVPHGLIWTSYWLPRVIMEADVVIGVPVLKNHNVAGVTVALKNQIGIAPSDVYHSPGSRMYKGALGHGPEELGRHIVDLNLARPLDFVVLDGLRGMTDGPTGGTLADPPMRLIMAGADPVAMDTVASLVMGYDPASVSYLGWATGAGLGTADVGRITVEGLRVSQVRRDFPAPYGYPAAQRAERTAPTVQIGAPGSGSVVTPEIAAWASASDDGEVSKVEFYVEDERQAVVTAPPYQATLDLSAYLGRSVSLRAVAYDQALNAAQDEVTVTVVDAPAPGTTSFQTATLSIPTYPYSDCLELRFAEVDSRQYPYHWLDWDCYYQHGDPSPVPQDYQVLVLENDYLRVTLLPELGGRVYQLINKASGYNELYQNPVIKPTQWGPPEQGWWLAAGGIEWCLPVEEHGYEWGEPWSWSVVTSTAGVTVTVRDTDSPDRLRAAVDLFLPADRGALAVTPHLENPTASELSYEFWLNAALAPGPENRPTAGLEFIFNADEMSVHSTGDSRLPGYWPQPSGPDYRFSWPVYNGVDFSRLENWHEWLGFFEYPQAAAGFMGVYDHDADEGVARVFPPDVARGAKGFAYGWSNPIDWHEWTDDGSAGVELHGGVVPTFWDTAALPAESTLSWTEYWYPVDSIGTISAATAEAALGVRDSGGRFHVGVQATSARAAGQSTLYVWDRASCVELARWSLPAVGPGNPFAGDVAAGGRGLDEVAVVYLDAGGHLLAALNPIDCLTPSARVEALPSWVDDPSFTVTWSGEDVWEGIATYDVQFRDGYEGVWTDWLTGASGTSAEFSGENGHTYFFRARARDLAGNQGAFGDEEWGQAFTTVLTDPAPVLVTSRKVAQPPRFPSGRSVAYTVVISNSGNLAAATALTDTLPTEMVLLTETLTATSAPPPTHADGVVYWSGEVPPAGAVRVRYVLSPDAATPFGVPLTNTAEIAGSVLGSFNRRGVVMQVHSVYMPLVFREWSDGSAP